MAAAVAQWVRAFTPQAESWCVNPSRDRPKSLEQVMTTPLPDAWLKVRVSRVLGDDHYKQMPRVTEGVAR